MGRESDFSDIHRDLFLAADRQGWVKDARSLVRL